jgi:hypothetical protein
MRAFFLVPFFFLLIGCSDKAELQRLRVENSQLKSQVALLQFQVGQANTHLQETKLQLAKKPAMPVKIGFRKALMGAGYVAVLNTTIKQDFPVVVIFKSKSLGTTNKFQVNLSQSTPSEIGHLQGATIFPGDEIFVENTQFESISATCPSL